MIAQAGTIANLDDSPVDLTGLAPVWERHFLRLEVVYGHSKYDHYAVKGVVGSLPALAGWRWSAGGREGVKLLKVR